MKRVSILVMAAVLAAAAPAGVLTWTGNGDGVSTFGEANWDLDGTGVPVAGTIDPGKAVLHDMLVNDSTALVGGGTGATGHWVIGDGYTLTVTAGEVKMATAEASSGAKAILGVNGGTSSYLVVTGGLVRTQYIHYDLAVTLGGDGILRFTGGGTPINAGCSINLTSETAQLQMINETVDAFITEHLDKITVYGNAAVVGQNLSVVSDGAAGSIVTVIPEPATLVLLGLGGLVSLRKRK